MARSIELQKYFDDGWEYVDGFSQSISTGTDYSTKTGEVLIILKKESIEL